MVTRENFLQSLQALIDRHSRDLSIILNALGIGNNPTPHVLTLAYVKHGDRLIGLVSQLPEENFKGGPDYYKDLFDGAVSHYTGSKPNTVITQEQPNQDPPKKDTSGKKWIIFTVVAVITLAIGIYFAIKSTKS